MISSFQDLTWRFRRFSDFLVHSGTRYRVHSPFIFSLIEEVIRSRKIHPDLMMVENRRKVFLASKEVIVKTDYGAGAGSEMKSVYPITIGRIARSSLSSSRKALRLFYLARHLGAGKILELGTSLGLTTAFLAKTDANCSVVTIEGCPELCRLARSNFNSLDLQNIEILEGRFEDRLQDALSRLGRVDLLFIDGDHRKEAVMANFERCRPFLHNDSVVILDDIHHSKGMEEAWDSMRQRHDITVSLDLYHMGWLFFRRESTKEHFRLRYL